MNRIATFRGKDFYQGLFDVLVLGMGAAKGYLFDHGPRVAVQAESIGRRLGMEDHALAEVFFGAVLADVGMIGLVEDEWEIPVPELSAAARLEVRRHPARSAAAAALIPLLDQVGILIRHHHEWWDGTGYPDGLAGEQIPLGSRVIRLADTVTALGEPRPHRPKRGPEEIRATVASSSGREFDPDLASAWLELFDADELPTVQSAIYREIRERAVETLLFIGQASEPDGALLLELLAFLIDAKDPYTGGHSRRVARLAQAVAGGMGLDDGRQEEARAAGYLHDLGKLAVPSRVLRKPEALTHSEHDQVRRHTEDGAELLGEIPVLRPLAPACRYHHERWDGGGYPDGLSGDDIPEVARILAVCDAYDAMTSERAYRSGRSHSDAIEEVRDQTGAQFGPAEAQAFLALPDNIFHEISLLHDEGWDPLAPDR